MAWESVFPRVGWGGVGGLKSVADIAVLVSKREILAKVNPVDGFRFEVAGAPRA